MEHNRFRSISELSRAQMRIIAENYANTSNEISGGIISRQYNLSKGTLNRLLKKVIVEHIVTEEMAMKIASKSAENAAIHGGAGAYNRVLNAYQRYLKERKLFRFDRKTESELTIEYATTPVSPMSFWQLHSMDRLLFNKTLRYAVIESLVEDDIVELLKKKTKHFNPSEEVEGYFDSLILERETMRVRGGRKKINKQKGQRSSETKKRRNRRKTQLIRNQEDAEYEQMRIDFENDDSNNN